MDESVRDSERDMEISSQEGAKEPPSRTGGIENPKRSNTYMSTGKKVVDDSDVSKVISERQHILASNRDKADEESARQQKKDEDKNEGNVKLPIDVDPLEIQEVVDQLLYRKETRNEQSIIALEEKVNYLELMAHIQSNHPKIDVQADSKSIKGKEPPAMFKNFSICDELGQLKPCCPCCKPKNPTVMAQKIGLGPTLFLMSTKAFGWFFFAITIINIPVLMYFARGNQSGGYNSVPDLFAILSMGNVGQSGFTCDSVKMEDFYEKDPVGLGYSAKEQVQQYNLYSNLNINCGIGGRIESLVQIGLSRNESSSCSTMLKNIKIYNQSYSDDCYYINSKRNQLFDYQTVADYQLAVKTETDTLTSDNRQYTKQNEREQEIIKNYTATDNFDFAETWFKPNCVNQTSCQIPGMTVSSKYTYTWDVEKSVNKVIPGRFIIFPRYDWRGYNIKDQCFQQFKDQIGEDKLPKLMVIAKCVPLKIQNPFNEEQEFEKNQLGYIVVFIDILTVICIYAFAEALNRSQEDYASTFTKQTIEMTDFTIRVKNLPHHNLYGDKDDILRAMLTAHFEEILRDEVKLLEQEKENDGGGDDFDFTNLAQIDPSKSQREVDPQIYEVADINFGKADMSYMNVVTQMTTLQNDYTRNYIRLQMLGESNPQQTKKIKDENVKLNEKFMKLRDKYLKDKKEKLAAMENEKVSQSSEPSVRYAYVTFRSKEAVELVKKSYKRYDKCNRCCLLHCCKCCSKCKEQRAELYKKHIFKKYPKITEACEPDNINWQNLGYTNMFRRIMVFINFLIALLLIVISLAFIIWLKQQTIQLKQEFNIEVDCPSKSDTTEFKELAWNDEQQNKTLKQGLMHCYCFQNLLKKGYAVRKIQFTEFQKTNDDTKKLEKDDTLYCENWLINYGLQQGLIVGTSLVVVGINVIASIILTISVGIEKNHTVNDETMGQFKKLTILQFINIGIIILIININLTSPPDQILEDDEEPPYFLGIFPIFNGQYYDLDSKWFSAVGKTLTLTLLINIFTPHLSKISLPFLKLFLRCLDRGCTKKLWKAKDESKPGDLDVNTKKLLQSDLNLLYTGDQIQSHYVYAQNFTYLCVVLMYSTGMPLLYPLASIFFFGFYWVYKGLLLKYYGKTTKFNKEIPIQSMGWVKFGLVWHIFIGSILLSNTEFFPKTDAEEDFHILDDDEFSVQGNLIFSYINRFQGSNQGLIYLVFMVLLIALWISFQVLGYLLTVCSCLVKPIKKLIKCLFCCCGGKKKKGLECKDIYSEFNSLSLQNIYSKAQDDLKDLETDMSKGLGNSIAYKQHRYEEETNFEATTIMDIYKKRVRQIELVVEEHLKHLHGNNQMNHFKNMPIDQKLRYLLKKQNFINKEQRMRMVDITQSFNLLDSQTFKNTKTVQEKVEENEQYSLINQ